MKKIIEFNIPEDNEEFELYNNAPRLNSIVYELHLWLRSKRKYEFNDKFIEVEDFLNEMLKEFNIEL